MARDTENRIDTVPTPRASEVDVPVGEPVGASLTSAAATASSEAATTLKPRRGPAARGLSVRARPVGTGRPALEVPQQSPAPSPLVTAPAAAPAAPVRRHRVRRAVWIAVAATVVVALGSGSAVYAAESTGIEAKNARVAATIRVDETVLAQSSDTALDEDAHLAVATAALTAGRARSAAQAQAVVDQANTVLAATPNAGDAPRAALGAASSAVVAGIAAPATSAAQLRTLAAGVAAPQQAAIDAQAAWQAAEDARIAAEQAAAAAAAAAAAQHAQAAAAAAAARSTAKKSTPRAAKASSGAAAGPVAAAPPAAAPSGIPAGGKVCAGSGGSGAGESSVGEIGAAINAYRAGLGLSQLSVSRSGGLVSHAVDMANTGGIWHSGSDNIVACVSNGSASTMVSAWSRSPSHDAQMRRTDVSSMAVGGASLGGWLFGAVKFS